MTKLFRLFYAFFMMLFLGLGIWDGVIEPHLPQHSVGIIDIYELIVYTAASASFGWLSTREK